MEQTPPGWYPHPEGGLRWWNGLQWANPPSVTPTSPDPDSTTEPPTDVLSAPAWTPSTPPAQREAGGAPLPKGQGHGRTVALVIGGLVAASFAASEMGAFREDRAPALQPVAAVTSPANGCDRFLALLSGMLRDKADDAEGARRFAQLRDAARENDPLLASDLQDVIDADSAAEVSASAQIIVRRCVAAGHLTPAEVQELAAAGLTAFAVPTSPAPTRRAIPPPAAVEEPAPAEEQQVDTLTPGEPPCAEVMPILKQHLDHLREWLDHFGSGLAGTPWTPGDRVTLRGLSPDTGDPIRETFTAAEGLLNDGWLDEDALDGDTPNRVLIYMEDGKINCADGP